MPYSAGEAQYAQSYQYNPIVLTGGVASGVPGGAMSILSVIQAGSFSGLPSSSGVGLDDLGASFYPVPGSTLQDNQIGNYPFANVAIACNAIINQPLKVSILMVMPASAATGGYSGKQSIMTSLQSTLAQHTAQEGTYTVATPSFVWNNCILLNLTDVSDGDTLQPQVKWQFDFVQPLISLQGATSAMNTLMSNIASGGPTDGSTSGVSLVTGDPSTISAGAVAPATAGTNAAGVPGAPTGTSASGGVLA